MEIPFTGGGGGNWSYNGVFNTTADTAYALNDVVFDTVNTSQTYICILAYTTATPYPAPSTDATHWLLLATNSATGGTGNVTYTPTVFPWTSGTAYVVGDIVSDKGQTYIAAVDNTAGTGNEPYLAGVDTWQSIGGLNANVFGGTWDANAGYGVGTIVNSTSGTAGLYVCIQAVPAVTPPATNPAPSASTTYWTMLNATAVPSGGAMTLNSSPWDVANAYPSQTLLNDYNTWGGFVTTAAVTGGDAPWTNPTPASWQNLTYGYSYFYGPWDATGATAYPTGSIVTTGGGVYSANVAQVPAVPPTPPALTPPNDPTNWSVVVQPAFTPAVLNSVNQSLDSTELVLVQTATGGIVVPTGGITLYNPLSFPGYLATTPAPYTLVPNAVYRISGYIYVSGFAAGNPTVQLGFNLNGNASATGNVYIYNTPGWSGGLAPLGQTFDAVFTAPADATVLGGVCVLQNTEVGALSADFTAILSSKTDTGANAYPVANSLIIQRLS
jgi:hypothetical protein